MAGKMRMGVPSGLTSLLKDGYKHFTGLEEAILRNIDACKQLAQITRTSLGPNGMNKLVLNHLEKLFVTSDAATIVQELEVAHPAANMLVRAAKMQEQEVGGAYGRPVVHLVGVQMGDGSNFVVTVAGELLAKAEALLRDGLHPADVIEGYKKASEKAYALMESLATENLGNLRDKNALTRVLVPVIAAKQSGYEDLLAGLVAEAVLNVMPREPRPAAVNVDNVRVAKLIGGTAGDSQIVKGVVVQRDAEGSVKRVEKAKIVVFGSSIEAASPETRGTVVIHNADELKNYNKSEEKAMEETIRSIAETGVAVIVAGGSISEIAMHFIEKYHMLAVKVMSKFELRRLCKAVGATALVRVGPPVPDEIGYADSVSVQELSSKLVTVFSQHDEESAVATIILRGATMNLLDDMERAIDDAVNTARVLCKDGRLIPGAGAIEIELAKLVNTFGEGVAGLEQHAIRRYAEALEIIPRILAETSGHDATVAISALYAAHSQGKTTVGIDIAGPPHITKDAAAAGIYDCFATKLSALRLASEVAITVLRVDQIIVSKQAGGPKPKAPGAPDED